MAYVHTILGQEIEWQDGDDMRAGVVWSAGPMTGTVWVIPAERREGEGSAVCVRVARGKAPEVRPADRERSEASVQEQGLACLAGRFALPKSLSTARLGHLLARGA